MTNIGQASRQSYLPAKTIRYYEEISLIKPLRAENGYRDYCDKDIHRLRFLQRSRSLGFTIEECRLLLSLYDDEHRDSLDVETIAKDKIEEIDRKVNELRSLKLTLTLLVDNCHGDHRPDCPIIDDLSRRNDQ
ncbi:MAG: Cu(I)-responsive transcriptional regulator [Roseovarius sp.]|nr:Cu(I)-responsive transcriptional regulator [Roseovarius sp.]